jgi:hypothetical protein
MTEPLLNDEPFLTDADIQEFIQMYKEEFGEPLSFKDARELASGFLELYRVLYLSPPDEPTGELSKSEK